MRFNVRLKEMKITTIQVLLMSLVGFIGTMGAFCLVCFGLIQFVEPVPSLVFAKLISVSGGSLLIYLLWWKFDVLGCASATNRFFRRKADLQGKWIQASIVYQIVIVLLTIATALHVFVQSRQLRNEWKRKPDQASEVTARKLAYPQR